MEFDNQLATLKRDFRVVSLKQLVEEMDSVGKVQSNTVCITVDDGYDDFYYYAFPLLQKYSLPATIFITTDFIDGKIWLWPDTIEYILKKTKCKRYSLLIKGRKTDLNLSTNEGRIDAWNTLADYCLTIPQKKRDKYLKNIANELNVEVPNEHVEEYKALTWTQLIEINQQNIEIGSHTCTHARLTLLSPKEVLSELTLSKERIESILNDSVFSFCYPYGRPEDFNGKIKKMVKKSGYKTAVTAFYNPSISTDIFELSRYGVLEDFIEFKKIVYGIKKISSIFKNNSPFKLY
jgi:peptidoglycan/xylan/chitin deacetylase (PgdA/CDA1 family)